MRVGFYGRFCYGYLVRWGLSFRNARFRCVSSDFLQWVLLKWLLSYFFLYGGRNGTMAMVRFFVYYDIFVPNVTFVTTRMGYRGSCFYLYDIYTPVVRPRFRDGFSTCVSKLKRLLTLHPPYRRVPILHRSVARGRKRGIFPTISKYSTLIRAETVESHKSLFRALSSDSMRRMSLK